MVPSTGKGGGKKSNVLIPYQTWLSRNRKYEIRPVSPASFYPASHTLSNPQSLILGPGISSKPLPVTVLFNTVERTRCGYGTYSPHRQGKRPGGR